MFILRWIPQTNEEERSHNIELWRDKWKNAVICSYWDEYYKQTKRKDRTTSNFGGTNEKCCYMFILRWILQTNEEERSHNIELWRDKWKMLLYVHIEMNTTNKRRGKIAQHRTLAGQMKNAVICSYWDEYYKQTKRKDRTTSNFGGTNEKCCYMFILRWILQTNEEERSHNIELWRDKWKMLLYVHIEMNTTNKRRGKIAQHRTLAGQMKKIDFAEFFFFQKTVWTSNFSCKIIFSVRIMVQIVFVRPKWKLRGTFFFHFFWNGCLEKKKYCDCLRAVVLEFEKPKY